MIPVLKPRLPSLQQLELYLKQIDYNRYYSNNGPLEKLFKQRLAAHFGEVDPSCISLTANATLALMLCLLAVKKERGKYCLLPSWSFSASGHAAIAAGLEPVFLDVDAEKKELSVMKVIQAVDELGAENIGAILVVSYLGSPIDTQRWINLRRKLDIPIVVDAAAAFDSLTCNELPTIVSFHATKIFSTGEGGALITSDVSLTAKVDRMKNFGFNDRRQASSFGINAKMSEYNCAIGLASLDGWQAYREIFFQKTQYYKSQILKNAPHASLDEGFGEKWVSASFSVNLNHQKTDELQVHLRNNGIETRMWWGQGMHIQSYFEKFRRFNLENTDRLGRSTIGLPLYYDISEKDIETITSILGAE